MSAAAPSERGRAVRSLPSALIAIVEPAIAMKAPPAALILGLSGLLPVGGAVVLEVALLARGWGHPYTWFVARPALGYAALILSFLGGTWWSAASLKLEGALLWRWLGIAVLPSLWAFASFFSGVPHGIATGLAAGLVLALAADRAAVAAGLLPRWWMSLRVPLSLGLAVEVLAAGWLA